MSNQNTKDDISRHLLAVAPNGARRMLDEHPNLPVTNKQLAETAKECLAAGATMIHLHVRDNHAKHSLSVSLYKQAIDEINKATNNGIFIQVTSEAIGQYSAIEQLTMIEKLQPAAVSIALREIKELNEKVINEHFIKMRKTKTSPQLILYNQADLSLYMDWLNRDVIPGSAYPVLFVIGKQQAEGSFENAILNTEFIQAVPTSSWMVCAFGKNEFQAGKLSIEIGGHSRLGFENNIHLKNGETAKSNAEIILQMAEYIKSKGLMLVNLEQTKAMMRPDWQ